MDPVLRKVFFDLGLDDSEHVGAAVRSTRLYEGTRADGSRCHLGWSVGSGARSYEQAVEETRIELTRVIDDLDRRKYVPDDIDSYLVKCIRNYWSGAMRVGSMPETRESDAEFVGSAGGHVMVEFPESLGPDMRPQEGPRQFFERMFNSSFSDIDFGLIWSAVNTEPRSDDVGRYVAVGRFRRHLADPAKYQPATLREFKWLPLPWRGDLRAAFNRRHWRLVMHRLTGTDHSPFS